MSGYEDYAAKAALYDQTRRAVGIEIVIGCLAESTIPLADQHVLDAGCGTGNYAAALLPLCSRVTGIDANEQMLVVANEKLSAVAPDRFHLDEGMMEELPYPDGSFDSALAIQVLHHLEDSGGEGWAAHDRVIGELSRVLRPGGVLVIGTSSRAQLRDGYWYYSLISRAADEIAARYAPIEVLREIMAAKDLRFAGQFVPIHETIQGSAYFDPRAPLSPEWRAGDSTWALISEEELEWAETTLRTLDEAGELDRFFETKDGRAPTSARSPSCTGFAGRSPDLQASAIRVRTRETPALAGRPSPVAG